MADDNYRKMNALENSERLTFENPVYLDKYRRAISDNPIIPAKRDRLTFNDLIVFLPTRGSITENNEHLSSDGNIVSQQHEVGITLEEKYVICFTTKMNPGERWFRRTVPPNVT